MTDASPATDPQLVVLGAGMSGLAVAIELRRAGHTSFVVLEQSQGVGGTWWDNRYPGAQCDVPSHLYSYSFAPNPDWSRVFAPSAEIQAYVERCVADYDLAPHLRLGVRITAARWDEAAARWLITTDDGATLRPRVFVASLGPLNRPRLPDGIATFRGRALHTARWDAALDVRGKRVVVVGSAASAVQAVPALARDAGHLTVFQRTPNWIVERPDRAYGARERALLRWRPWGRLYRGWIYWEFETRFGAFKGRGLLYRALTWMARRHLRRQVPDPALRERLTPHYPMGCKRILISNDFYPALARTNVTLLNQSAAGFTADGVVAADGTTHAADIIVCATGFDTLAPLAAVPIVGRAGLALADAWRDGPEAYRGVAVTGFPNLFLMLGPNTATGHTSALISIEAQARYVAACVTELARRGDGSMEVRPEAFARHNAWLQDRLARTVWASPGCDSWYKTRTGKILATYPGYITRYALGMRRPRYSDYTFSPGGLAMIALATIAALALAVVALEFGAPERAAAVWLDLERRRAGLSVREARIDGFVLPYLEGGRGDPLLLIHGFGGDKDNFTRVAPYLTPHFRVIALDLPGFGAATRDGHAAHHIAAQVTRVQAFAAALGLTRFHLGGNSMGGFIAGQYAATHPGQVRSLWLLDAAGCSGAFDMSALQQFAIDGTTPLLVRRPEDFDLLLRTATHRPPLLPRSVRRALTARALRDLPLHERILREIGSESPLLDTAYAQITTPTLIVWGREDRILNPVAATAMQRLFVNSLTVFMDATGHMPMVERPRRAATDFIRFVAARGA